MASFRAAGPTDMRIGYLESRADNEHLLKLTGRVIAAYVGNNAVPPGELPGMIKSLYAALTALNNAEEAPVTGKPAIAIKRSVTNDFIVCLEDGKKLKMLKRYLRSRYQLTPEAYRAKWGLPVDYPMVAPSYAARRSAFAKQIGLGKKPRPKARRRG